MNLQKLKAVQRDRRKTRIRKKVEGTSQRPRLTVFRSLNHIYAQVINDDAGVTLCSASTAAKDLRGKVGTGGNVAAAKEVGKAIAAAALAQGVKAVCLDRNGYRYHGRIKALADAAREGGLAF